MRTIYFELMENSDTGAKRLKSNSLSGGERNRIFFRRDGNFVDLSLLSGVDFREDGRSFVLFDANQDGWLDMGITSPNHPRFRVVKSVIGDSKFADGGFVEVSLIGGHDAANANLDWSPRDAYGAKVIATIDGQKRMFRLSCGQGLSTVNAKRIHIGLGAAKSVEKIKVIWPSGKTSVQENVEAGSRVEILERTQ
jgi:hypothetical protein